MDSNEFGKNGIRGQYFDKVRVYNRVAKLLLITGLLIMAFLLVMVLLENSYFVDVYSIETLPSGAIENLSSSSSDAEKLNDLAKEPTMLTINIFLLASVLSGAGLFLSWLTDQTAFFPKFICPSCLQDIEIFKLKFSCPICRTRYANNVSALLKECPNSDCSTPIKNVTCYHCKETVDLFSPYDEQRKADVS